MSVVIRLSRVGAKNQPYFRVVVADSRYPRDGRYLEKVGTYSPMLPREHKDRVVLKLERIQHWMKLGAKPTDRVQKFLFYAGVGEMPKITKQTKKDKPRTKTQERLKAAEEAAKAKADAAAAAPAAEGAAT